MSVRIINADVMEGLRQLPDESVHCVVTSPPYWGLRDYGVEGQIGLETTFDAFVGRMVEVFREVRRVLRSDGTCWMNLGDSYNTGTTSGRKPTTAGKHGYWENPSISHRINANQMGLKPKDLVGIPWRVAFALQADGWWLRSDIVWSKPNPMPESVTDRPTKAHEYIFLLTKSERYFYDHEAIKEDAVSDHPSGNGFKRDARLTYQNNFGEGRGNPMQWKDIGGSRNKRSVWSIATAPFSEAHFATFPPELPKICIKAGCPVGGTVLDPFSGAGTTCMVADRLQRNGIGIELNPEYAAMAERRISGDRGALLDIMEAAQ
jgi:DNA modification methylase